jgi:hypothetical protein
MLAGDRPVSKTLLSRPRIEVKTPRNAKKRARDEITTSLEEDIEKVSFIFFSKLTDVPYA